jgi:hypothetical protein
MAMEHTPEDIVKAWILDEVDVNSILVDKDYARPEIQIEHCRLHCTAKTYFVIKGTREHVLFMVEVEVGSGRRSLKVERESRCTNQLWVQSLRQLQVLSVGLHCNG